jgi:hypothetical protein
MAPPSDPLPPSELPPSDEELPSDEDVPSDVAPSVGPPSASLLNELPQPTRAGAPSPASDAEISAEKCRVFMKSSPKISNTASLPPTAPQKAVTESP